MIPTRTLFGLGETPPLTRHCLVSCLGFLPFVTQKLLKMIGFILLANYWLSECHSPTNSKLFNARKKSVG